MTDDSVRRRLLDDLHMHEGFVREAPWPDVQLWLWDLAVKYVPPAIHHAARVKDLLAGAEPVELRTHGLSVNLRMLPPRMPMGHPANLLRQEISFAQPPTWREQLTREWWATYGDEYAANAKRSADAARGGDPGRRRA